LNDVSAAYPSLTQLTRLTHSNAETAGVCRAPTSASALERDLTVGGSPSLCILDEGDHAGIARYDAGHTRTARSGSSSAVW
jgi:hypothetical protein